MYFSCGSHSDLTVQTGGTDRVECSNHRPIVVGQGPGPQGVCLTRGLVCASLTPCRKDPQRESRSLCGYIYYSCQQQKKGFVLNRGVRLVFTGGHIRLTVAFKGLNVIARPQQLRSSYMYTVLKLFRPFEGNHQAVWPPVKMSLTALA